MTGIEPDDEPESESGFIPPASIGELVEDAVRHFDGVQRVVDGESTVLSRAGQAVATLRGGVLEVRLDPLVAGAALRTPDTSPSPRGEGWVRFAPNVLDRYAVDRAGAWLGHAWRHALG